MTERSVELRPLVDDDLEAIRELHQRSYDHDGVPMVVELDELREEFDSLDAAHDLRLAFVDGALAGYAFTYHLPSDVKEERCYIMGEVDPALRRHGVGTALLRWGVGRATEQLRSSDNDLPKYIRVDAYDYIDDAHALYAREGFEPVRYNEELLRSLDDLPPTPELDDVTIVPWPDDRDEEIRLEKNEAFADHWGSTPTSQANWAKLVRGFGSRVDLSFVALDPTGAVIGHCLNMRYPEDDERIGRKDAWIDSLGTLRAWRGRGIASAMIAHSLTAFAGEGLTHASIGVDSANPTGAAELYRALGFEREQRTITHQIEI